MFTDRCVHEIRLTSPFSWNTNLSCPMPTPLTDWLNARIQQLAFIKSSNEWQFDGDDSSAHFTVTNCCNGTLCVAELALTLFCALRDEPFVISRYIYLYIYRQYNCNICRTVYMGMKGTGIVGKYRSVWVVTCSFLNRRDYSNCLGDRRKSWMQQRYMTDDFMGWGGHEYPYHSHMKHVLCLRFIIVYR